jgi:hypothetical protein
MRVEDLTKFEGECPIIVVFSAYMDIRIPVEENKGATIFISHLDSCLGWDNEEEEK